MVGEANKLSDQKTLMADKMLKRESVFVFVLHFKGVFKNIAADKNVKSGGFTPTILFLKPSPILEAIRNRSTQF